MATVRQIAEHLDVSEATVSRVLNSRPGIGENTRRRVIQAATQMGFARNVGLKTSRYIGYVHALGHFVGAMGEYHSSLLGGVATVLGRRQYDLALIDPYRDKRPDETYTQFFFRKDLRGVLMQVRPHNMDIIKTIADEGFPMVTIASKSDHPAVNWVVIDSGSEFSNAVEYLVRLGHRRIALVIRTDTDYDHLDRVSGYRTAHDELGLALDPDLLFYVNGDAESGASAVRRMIVMNDPPTAALFTNPGSTIGALRTCRAMGIRVPEQFSIIGFDDGRRRFDHDPPFTAVCQDAQRLGDEAASWLVRLIQGEVEGPLRLSLPAIFEVHQTTGPAPDKNG